MVNQLLALARAEDAGAGAARAQPCDLARLATEVVRDFVPRAIDKRIDLGYEGAETGAPRGRARCDGKPMLLQRADPQPGRQRAAATRPRRRHG